MRKFLATVLVAAMVFISAPAFAVANPFMDIPAGHWAYDAVAQLAARGILSGFPDGTYRGGQPITRFEVAMALARVVEYGEAPGATRQDMEMMMRLIVEFSDELDALGARLDALGIGAGAGVPVAGLGGWRFSGMLRMDANAWDNDRADMYFQNTMARLHIERFFGANDDTRLFIRIRQEHGLSAQLQRFYVDFPFLFDTRMTVGRFDRNFEGAYVFNVGGISAFQNTAFFGGTQMDGLAIGRNFAVGRFDFAISRQLPAGGDGDVTGDVSLVGAGQAGASDNNLPIEITARLALQPAEQFGLDFGTFVSLVDDANTQGDRRTADIMTLWGGLNFNFNRYISLRGIYYWQDHSEDNFPDNNDGFVSSAQAFRVMLNIDQEMTGFSSLWLGFDQIDQGFWTRNALTSHTFLTTDLPGDGRVGNPGPLVGVPPGVGGTFTPADVTTWRIGATQQWNPTWRTWLFFGQTTFDEMGWEASNPAEVRDIRATQFGLGVEYRLNPHVAFALNYTAIDWNNNFGASIEDSGFGLDNHLIRFRTQINF